ncbi:MAG: hypothetical protein RBR74_11350 [Ignavibacteriaceae bacterium]|jgi:hypothetical protein|nr:hypothetical protein [Ignavibacteriaceae bacterium]
MSDNKSALIRYRTINSCLSGNRMGCTINDLIKACSEALAEERGDRGLISERTIRDDIRIMRSEIMGFNAPIKCKNGLYYYSDPDYTLQSIFIADGDLAIELIEVLEEVDHPKSKILVGRLKKSVKRASKEVLPGMMQMIIKVEPVTWGEVFELI